MSGAHGVVDLGQLLLAQRGFRDLDDTSRRPDARVLRLGSVLAALAVLAGCSSSSGSGGLPAEPSISHAAGPASATAVAPSSAASSALTSGSASAPASAVPSAGAPPSESAAASSPTPAPTATALARGGSVADACKAIADTAGILTSLALEGPKNPGLPALERLIAKLRTAGPSEIRGDLAVIADFDQGVVEALLAGKQLDIKKTPALTAALKHEAAWTATHCAT